MIRRVVLAEKEPSKEKQSSVRHIGGEIVSCQYCKKKGHTADRCRLINNNKFQGNKNQNYSRFNPSSSSNNNNNNNNFNNTSKISTKSK